MDNPIRQKCQTMLGVLDEIKKLRGRRDGITSGSIKIGEKEKELMLLKQVIGDKFLNIENTNSEIFNLINDKGVVAKDVSQIKTESVELPKPDVRKIQGEVPKAGAEVKKPTILSPELASKKFRRLNDKQKEEYMKELNIDYVELKEFIKEQKDKNKVKGEIKKEDYTIYTPKDEAVVANKYAKKYADKIIKKYPRLFDVMFTQYKKVNMDYLSRSWVSMIIFYSILSMPAALILMLILKFFFSAVGAFELSIFIVVLLVIFAPAIVAVALYFYPGSLIGDRSKKIKNELPFAVIHMSAVAGSGAQPISIFELLTEGKEYPELKIEIRKILNYVNLFGYNLSTALKATAATTPSLELKELLNGMVSTIETGGDLKAYLKGKADDMLINYRNERKQDVEALGTYSEIYTSILIAAPLLLVVTLAIMNSITSSIAGMSIPTLAYLGVGLGLPFLNVGFILFLKAQLSNV